MTEQEYKHIRNLAWSLLIDAHISQLPIDIASIANIYNLSSVLNDSATRYENALNISQQILHLYGCNSTPENCKYLAVRIMAPMIVIKELNIQSASELSDLTELPYDISMQRYERYKMLLKRNSFYLSSLERKVYIQFRNWIDSRRN